VFDYQPGAIEVTDLNGDAIPDLAVTKSERDEVDVFLGDGAGGFRTSGPSIAASASGEFFTHGLAVLDANEDRRPDLVTFNGKDHSFGILIGDGRGRFTALPPVKRDPAGTRQSFAFGDVDGDGHIDAVVARRRDDAEPGRVSVFRGDGSGRFVDALRDYPVPPNPIFLALADVNGDRRPDLLISHNHSRGISIHMNDGRGGFAAAAGSPLDIGREAYGLSVADMNRDGHPDLVAATVTSATVLLGNGAGQLTAAPGSPFRAGPGAYQVAIGDLDEDGKPDVVVSSFEGSALTILFSR
jgi:hypothetical protein